MKIQVSRKRKSSKSFVEGGWANYKVFVGTNPLKTRGTHLIHTPKLEVVMPHKFTAPYQYIEIVFFLILGSRFCLKDTSLSHSDT